MTTPPTPPADNLAAEGGPRSEMSEQIAEVIAWHRIEIEHRAYPAYACACEQWHGAMGDDGGPNDGQHDTTMGHAAHVADALADLLAARDRRVRAEAVASILREVSDQTDSIGHHWSGAPALAFFALAGDLRDRADRVEAAE